MNIVSNVSCNEHLGTSEGRNEVNQAHKIYYHLHDVEFLQFWPIDRYKTVVGGRGSGVPSFHLRESSYFRKIT